MNKVETFNKFNQGVNRTDRKGFLEGCGFELTKVVKPHLSLSPIKPNKAATNHAKALSQVEGCSYHAVTLPRRDFEGNTFYEVWTRKMQEEGK